VFGEKPVRIQIFPPRLAAGWTVRGSKPGGGAVFRTGPDRPWGPHSLLLHRYVVITGDKRPGRDVDHPPQLGAEVKTKVQLFLLPLGSS
jgi:hypothetical protein